MVVLLIAHHIHHLVDGEVLEAEFGCTNVLCHVHTGAVGAQQQFLVKSVLGKVGPYRTVLLAEEKALFQALLNGLLAHEVSVAFVVNLVKAYTQRLVGLVKSGIHPLVHLAPQGTHLGVASLPLYEHGVRLLNERTLLFGLGLGIVGSHALSLKFSLQLLHLGTVVLVKGHIVVANQVVALLAAAFGCFAVAIFEPCQHRLADVYTAVVHNIGFHHAVAVGLYYAGQGPAQQVVAHMAQVQGLVGVGR